MITPEIPFSSCSFLSLQHRFNLCFNPSTFLCPKRYKRRVQLIGNYKILSSIYLFIYLFIYYLLIIHIFPTTCYHDDHMITAVYHHYNTGLLLLLVDHFNFCWRGRATSMLGIFGHINIKKVLKNTPTTRSKSLFGSLICIVIVRLARQVLLATC